MAAAEVFSDFRHRFCRGIGACGRCVAAALVLFRVIQGVGGRRWCHCHRRSCLKSNAPEDYGRAMSIWGIGATLAPMLGRAGRWRRQLQLRWVFYINLPIGMLAFLGLFISLPGRGDTVRRALIFRLPALAWRSHRFS